VFALVDVDDYERVSQILWYLKSGYPRATDKRFLHRLIAGDPPAGSVVDHLDRNRLDNRKSNLRSATFQESTVNRGMFKNNTSGYKGVWFESKWRAGVGINGRYVKLGSFETAEDAARAYDEAALKNFGPHALLNFPVKN
jgi:hypothetical protein